MTRFRELLVLTLLAGLGIATGGVTTFAAWAGSTVNSGNQVTTGVVDLTDSDGGSTVFTVSGASPGSPPPARCVVVTNAGTIPVTVALYGTISGTLKNYLDVKVTRGANGGTCASPGTGTVLYDGPLDTFPTTSATAITDPAIWPVGVSRPFVFEFTVENDENAQGQSASIGMTWEGRS